jgi:hypothetical protein
MITINCVAGRVGRGKGDTAIILVVDDRPVDQALLVTLLGYYGQRVIAAAGG